MPTTGVNDFIVVSRILYTYKQRFLRSTLLHIYLAPHENTHHSTHIRVQGFFYLFKKRSTQTRK